MKKINKFLFLAILLSLVLSNCQKKEEKSTNTQNKKVENVSNQDVLREISLDEMLDFEHIPKNWKEEFREIAENMPSYGNNVVKISMYFYEKDFFYDYKKIFLDDNNNFVKPDEKQINDFLKMASEKNFSDFDSVIQVLEKENKNDKLFGKLTENWIESLKIWKLKADNLKNYYQSGDYKKDNFAKGKTLNSETGKYDDMVFDFSGDDDVWVYVDDELVLDLGGAHTQLKGNINFAKNKVWYELVASADQRTNERNVEKKAFFNKLSQGKHTLKVLFSVVQQRPIKLREQPTQMEKDQLLGISI